MREDFVGKYGEKYGRYWDKVTGGHVDVFLTNAAIEANKEIETLYNNLVKEWRKNIPIAQKDIDDLEKKIAAERKQFRETIQAEFERTVIDPLKELQQKRVEKCKADKAVAVEDLRTKIKKCKSEMLEVAKHVTIKEEKKELSSSKLAGKSFCFTGTCCKPRKELQELVETNGGENKSGVTKNLNYLVTDDKDTNSSKGKKARELGIQIISSEEFLKML
jgi:NAD-dependent DNA ligase